MENAIFVFHVTFLFFLSCSGAGELLDQISIIKSSSWSEGVSRWVQPTFTILYYPFLNVLLCKVMISDVLKCSQSNLVALPFVSKLKSSKSLRWLNCCFKQSVFSACPRQTSGRLVLMFTNRTRWQSLKRASLESLTPACVSAGKHTDSIHLLTYYLHYDCSQWSIVFYLLCWFCHFALVIQWLDHTGRSVYVMFKS